MHLIDRIGWPRIDRSSEIRGDFIDVGEAATWRGCLSQSAYAVGNFVDRIGAIDVGSENGAPKIRPI